VISKSEDGVHSEDCRAEGNEGSYSENGSKESSNFTNKRREERLRSSDCVEEKPTKEIRFKVYNPSSFQTRSTSAVFRSSGSIFIF